MSEDSIVTYSNLKEAIAYVSDEPAPSGAARAEVFSRVMAQLAGESVANLSAAQRSRLSRYHDVSLTRMAITQATCAGAWTVKAVWHSSD